MKVVEGDKRNSQDSRLFVDVNIIWKSDRNQPSLAYLSPQCETSLWNCLFLSMCAHVLDLFTCTFVCLWWHPPPPKRMCGYLCVQTDKALRYCRNLSQARCPCWVIKECRASFSLTKEHVWLFAWLAVSLSLCLKGGTLCIGEPLSQAGRSNTASECRNHEGRGAALLIHIKLGRSVNLPCRTFLMKVGYFCAFPWNMYVYDEA